MCSAPPLPLVLEVHISLFFFLQARFYLGSCHSRGDREQTTGLLCWLTHCGRGELFPYRERVGGTHILQPGERQEGKPGLGGGRPGYLPLARPGLLPITLRGSGPRGLSWGDGVETQMDSPWSSVNGAETEGAQDMRPGPEPSGPPLGHAAGWPGATEQAWPGALRTQPSLPQAPSSQARKKYQHPLWLQFSSVQSLSRVQLFQFSSVGQLCPTL